MTSLFTVGLRFLPSVGYFVIVLFQDILGSVDLIRLLNNGRVLVDLNDIITAIRHFYQSYKSYDNLTYCWKKQ